MWAIEGTQVTSSGPDTHDDPHETVDARTV